MVAITGDGGFMFGVQELATAVQFNIGVVTLVFNNNAYGNVRRDQRERFDGRVVASDLVNPDFVKLAESFGVGAARVTSPEHFPPGAGKGAGAMAALSDRIEVPKDSETRPVGRSFIRRSRKAFRSLHRALRNVRLMRCRPISGMLAVGERRDAVKGQPRRPAPHHDIAMLEPKAARLVAALQTAEQEDRGQSQRHRDDRRCRNRCSSLS